MKKIILAAATVAIALSGCSREEITNQSADRSIQFKTLEVSTRAEVKTINDLQTSGFDVFAFYATTTTSTDQADYTNSYMTRTKVTYNGSVWGYNPLKYWPTDGKSLVFYAYDNVFTWDGTPGTKAAYTAPNTVKAGVDALVAKTTYLNTPDTKVPLVFHHALSQVVVSARSGLNHVEFEILNVTLTNVLPDGLVKLLDWVPVEPEVKTSPTLDITGNALVWEANSTVTGSVKDYVLGLNSAAAAVPFSTTTYTYITDDDGPLFLIPQQLGGGTPLASDNQWVTGKAGNYLVVQYIATDKETSAVVLESTTAIPINTNLLPGIRYHYRLTLNGYGTYGADGPDAIKPIEFTASVYDWQEAIFDLNL